MEQNTNEVKFSLVCIDGEETMVLNRISDMDRYHFAKRFVLFYEKKLLEMEQGDSKDTSRSIIELKKI